MNFAWLKKYMPKTLYGRAALILLVPVVTIQLVVSIVFIQRLYEGVTRQMTENVLLELKFILERIEASPDLAAARREIERIAPPLALEVKLPAGEPVENRRHFYDLSGREMADVLNAGLPGFRAVDLVQNGRLVKLLVATRHGDMEIIFSRRRVAASNPHQLLVLMVFTSMLMTLIAYLFLRNQLRPIKRLVKASEAFGKGEIVPYSPSGAIEVRAAGASFLAMRARIERHIEQRTMMLSGVSHDLRTPITRLRLGLSMLEDCPEKEDLLRDVEDMERLIEGFLDFARGNAEDDPDETDPVALVREVVEKARRAGGDVILAEVAGEAGGATARLRANAVERALQNLIDNALRYGNRAEVRVTLGERSIRITIEDDGPGIPPDMRERAIRPFTRLEPARNQDRGTGVGLGLAIAADIARAHGGSLRLTESERLGGLRVDLVFAR